MNNVNVHIYDKSKTMQQSLYLWSIVRPRSSSVSPQTPMKLTSTAQSKQNTHTPRLNSVIIYTGLNFAN